jgi:RHS repeat-associated protein
MIGGILNRASNITTTHAQISPASCGLFTVAPLVLIGLDDLLISVPTMPKNRKGHLATRTYPNGIKSYWDYDTTTGQLKETGHKQANGALIYSDTFTYYPGTSLYQTISHTTPQGVTTTSYDYDAWQRLTSVTEATGRKTLFQYDPFGNRTHETITNTTNPGANGGTPKAYGAYRYGYDGNRLQTLYYTPPAGVEAVQEQFTYDNAGRIKTRNHATHGLTTYSWDDRGYLIKLEKPGTTISYAYNALGARTSKSVNGVTTRYVTAPVFGMNHMLMELDGNNNVTARYVYGGHEQLIAEPSPGNSANDQYLLHGGTVGNVTHAVSRGGTVQTESSYDAFGNRTLVSGSSATRFGYTGEESDAESGLLYLRARYYDPAIVRFISVDPYLGRLAEPATQNRYVYVQNNPMNYVDPSGLSGTHWKCAC